MTMLHVLHAAEQALPRLLPDRDTWRSVYIDYHPPFVERLWRTLQVDGVAYRLYLHRIRPCAAGEALLHPHPWPSAMRVLRGRYEMALGYSTAAKDAPETVEVVSTLTLGPGAEYEMVHPHGWHSVRPLDEASLSIMVTGAPWGVRAPEAVAEKLRPLTVEEREALFVAFTDAVI